MLPDHIDTLYRVSRQEARRREADFARCDADELEGVAVEACVAAYRQWDERGRPGAWGALARTVCRRSIINHLRAHGPVSRSGEARPYTDSLDAPIGPDAGLTRGDFLSAADRIAPDALPEIKAVSTSGRGTLYRLGESESGGRDVRAQVPPAVLLPAVEAYVSHPYPPIRPVAERFGLAVSTLRRVLDALGLARTQAQALTLHWQARHGEPLDPNADPARETLRLALHADTQAEVARTMQRSGAIVQAHRRAQRRRARGFTPTGDISTLNRRDRRIVRAVASGHRLGDVARRFGLTEARVSQITNPHRPPSCA